VPESNDPVALDALTVDCSSLGSFLVDLPPRARIGMLTEQSGFAGVIAEIRTHQSRFGERAGITAADFDSFQESNDRIAQIDARLPALRKLLEILVETRAKEDHKRQRQVYDFAEAIDRRARTSSDTDLLAKYEKTRAYRSANAIKGAKTRAKRAETTSTPSVT